MKNIPANIFKRILAVTIDHLIINIALLFLYFQFLAPTADQILINNNTYLIFLLFNFLYFFILEAIYHKTIGKKIFNLKVVSSGGKTASWTQILIRNMLRPIDFIGFYLLGFIFVALTAKSQRVGDLLAKTKVVENV